MRKQSRNYSGGGFPETTVEKTLSNGGEVSKQSVKHRRSRRVYSLFYILKSNYTLTTCIETPYTL